MPRCSECEARVGVASEMAPGATLEYVSKRWIEAGSQRKGIFERYRCLACNTWWSRSVDPADPRPIWEPA